MSSPVSQNTNAVSKVLVVEDEPILRFLISEVLAHDHGLTVVEAGSGDMALRLLGEDGDIACVFTDVRMPGATDGIALARHVRHDHPTIRVLMTSGNMVPSAGVEDVPFVAKPYNLQQVAAMIEDLVRSFQPTPAIG